MFDTLRLRSVRLAAALAVVIALLALAGWALNVNILNSVLPGLVTMKVNTAVCVLLTAVALYNPGRPAWARMAGPVCAGLAFLAGALVLSQYFVGWDLGIDQLFLRDTSPLSQAVAPGRMAAATALSVVLLNAAFLLEERLPAWLAEAARFTVLGVSILVLLGYLYGQGSLYGAFPALAVAISTALALGLLAVGSLVALPGGPLVRFLLSDTVGGQTSRRLLPAAILVPGIIGWLALLGETRGLYNADVAVTLATLATIVLLSVVVAGNGRLLHQADMERRRAQEALRKSEAMFSTFYEYSPDAVLLIDSLGRIARVNGQVEREFGYDRSELIGQPIEVLVPERLRRRHTAHRNHFAGAPRARPMGPGLQLMALRHGGAEFPVEIMLGPVTLDGETLTLTVVRDVTERQRMDAALREQTELLQSILDSIGEAVVVAERSGRFVIFNPAARELYGAEPDEYIAPDWPAKAQIYLPDGVTPCPPEQVPLLRALKGEATDSVELFARRNNRPNGAAVLVTGRPLRGPDGQVRGGVVILRDISQRKEYEKALAAQALELQRSNAELEQFAYVASHDLQEPLRAVAGGVRLLQSRYEGKLDAKADEYIGVAADGAARMHNLINGLLSYARVDTRGGAFAPTDGSAVMRAVLQNLSVAIEESGAAVTADALPEVQADALQLGQLLQNLVGNALKFRGSRQPQIHVGAERRPDGWLFSVRDNGIGIEPQYFERIFGIFQRLHTRTEYPGTGLGLALCRKIVERHGGELWVESEPGQGSTFFFTLPDRR